MKSRSKGIALSYVYLILNMVSGLFLSSYLINSLGETEYGIYKTVASFVNYLILLEFGTGTVMTRNISMCRGSGKSREKINEHISTIWTSANVIGAIIAIVSVGMYFSLDFIYKNTLSPQQLETAKNIFIFVVIHLIISFYLQTFKGITLGYEDYSFGSVIKTIRTLLRTVLLSLAIFFWKYSIVIAIVDTLIATAELISSYVYCKKKFDISLSFKYFNKKIFLSILPFSFALFLQTIVNQANNNVDSFLIGIFKSPEDVTFYSVSLFIFSVFSSACSVPVSMYAPQVAKELSSGTSISELTPKIASASKLTALVGGSILFGFIAAGKPFIALLYGKEYLEQNVWIIAVILMIPYLLAMLLSVVENILDVLGKRLIRSLALMGTTLVNIALTVWWLNVWGTMGAAIATFVCTMVGQVILMSIYYKKSIKINVFYLYGQCFKCIIPCQVISAIAGYLVSSAIGYDNKLLSAISLLAGGGTYVIVFALTYLTVDKEARIKTVSVLNKFLKK